MLACCESEIPFYRLSTFVNQYSTTWSNVTIGMPTSFTTDFLPFFFLVYLLQKVVISAVLVQAIVFFLFLFAGAISIYFICVTCIKKNNDLFAFSSSLFYIFNFTALISILNRLQYPFMYFYAVIPLSLLFFIKAVTEKKVSYIIFLNILLAIFSIAFLSVPTIIVFWLIIGLYLLYIVIINYFQKKITLSPLGFFLFFFILWLLSSAWWLLPYIQVFSGTPYLQNVYSSTTDLATFLSISQSTGNLSYLFRLMSLNFLLEMKTIWSGIYFTPLFIIISYLVPFLAFFPFLLRKKPVFIYYFIGFALLLLFLEKGSAGPFGGIFLYLFVHMQILAAFRNPFEKFSFAVPLCYAPLIGYSLSVIYFKIKKKYTRFAFASISIICLLLFCVLVFPIWNGWVFSNTFIPTNNVNIGYYVQVPDYYSQANNWFNNDKENYRVVALPIAGQGITNEWQYGYNGVEYSNGLFDKPFISYLTGINSIDFVTSQLEPVLFSDPHDFTKLLSILNAKYLLIRSDINYQDRNMTNPATINDYLATASGKLINGLTYNRGFGKLKIFTNRTFIPEIYSAKDIFFTPVDMSYADMFSLTHFETGDAAVNYIEGNNSNDFISQNAKTIVLEPTGEFSYYLSSTIDLNVAERQLPYISHLPGSPLYPLVSLREDYDLRSLTQTDQVFFLYLALTDKRVAELQQLVSENKNKNLINEANANYLKSLQSLQNFINEDNQTLLSNNQQTFSTTITAEYTIISHLAKNTHNGEVFAKTQKTLHTFMLQTDVTLFYQPIITSAFSNKRSVYNFFIPYNGVYEILVRKDNLSSPIIQINNAVKQINPTAMNGWVVLDRYKFSKGNNEIQLPAGTNDVFLRYENVNYQLPVAPYISFQKINSAQYLVHIRNASEPFFLMFPESYHPLWTATYMDTNTIIPSKYHFFVNGYANGWYINKRGNYDITIEFSAQKTLVIGKWISGIALLLSCLLVLYQFILRRRK